MIELSTVNKETLTTLLRNTEHTPHLIWKKTNFLRTLEQQLIEQYGKEYKEEIAVVLTFSAKCVRYNTKGFKLSLNKTHYTAANKQYGHKLSADRMRDLVMMLENDGYVQYLKGFYRNEEDYARSVVVLKTPMLNMIDPILATKFGLSREEYLDSIQVKDTEKSVKTKKIVKGVLRTTSVDVFKDTRTVRGIAIKRTELKSFNKQLEKSLICINGAVENCVIANRIFEDNLEGCGRYYLGGFQTSKSAARETITIDGQATCEVDYKNIQPRCLATLENIAINYDPYEVNLAGVTRKFIKGCFFSVLFSMSRGGAKSSITNKLKEEGITHVTSEQVLTSIENNNTGIKHNFYNKALYRSLQNMDARMAEYIINHFTSKGVTVLPWHDSFVIQSIHKDELIRVMEAAWVHVLGSNLNFAYDVEFYNTPEAPVMLSNKTSNYNASKQVGNKKEVRIPRLESFEETMFGYDGDYYDSSDICPF